MKNHKNYIWNLILIVILIGFNLNLKAQNKDWIIVDSVINSGYAHNMSLRCADTNYCIILTQYEGTGGFSLRQTTDGGKIWKNVYIDKAYYNNYKDYKKVPYMWDIAYPNTKLIIAVGDSGFIVRSTDNGETWVCFHLDTNMKLGRIRMLDENYGIMMGCMAQCDRDSDVKCLVTIDGGISWDKMNSSFVFGPNEYGIINENLFLGMISLKNSNSVRTNYLFQVKDSWKFWDTVQCPVHVTKMTFIDENNIWLAGGLGDLSSMSQIISYTSDGGIHWETQRDTIYNGFPINDIKFFDSNFGIAGSASSNVLMTNDGGKSWENMLIHAEYKNTPNFNWVSGIQIPSYTTAYCILDNNYIYKYTRDFTGVVEPKKEFSISIFPNPVESELTLNLPPEFLTEKIKIYSIEGILVYQEPSEGLKPSEGYKIDVSGFSAGVYYVKVGDRVLKFIKI